MNKITHLNKAYQKCFDCEKVLLKFNFTKDLNGLKYYFYNCRACRALKDLESKNEPKEVSWKNLFIK